MKLSLLVVISTFFVGTIFAQGGPGLSYSYFEGDWTSLPNFNSLTPVKRGNSTNINLNIRNKDVQWGAVWYGAIQIPATGNYTFETNSDDGSKLYIGDYGFNITSLVNNDGLHSAKSASGVIYLTAGLYPFYVSYYQKAGDQLLEVYWQSNTGLARQRIPDNVFTNSTAVAGGSTSGALSYAYYEGSWATLPDFSSLTPVKTGTSPNFDLTVRNRTTNYAINWKGSITIPAAGTYTFETNSDDGSKLYINNFPVAIVNNDGLHGDKIVTGSSYLTPGTYAINVAYFQSGGTQTMEVYWSSNTGIARQRIPDAAFTGTIQTPTPDPVPDPTPPTPPSSESGGLTGVINYYFSTSDGDDSRSSAQAQNPNTPWKSISKLNSIISGVRGGDAVLFKRGDTFEGAINVSNSGSSSSSIIFSSYGTGAKPVISGFNTLTNWTSVGGGVWEASCPSPNAVSIVTLNGILQPMGRWPNANAPSKGYNSIDSHVGTSQISDNALNGSNWTGAEVVVRKNNWVLDRALITYQSGGTLYFNSPSDHESNNNYGYFIQNSPYTLDQLGEWYYDNGQKKLRMYFGSAGGSNTVKAGVVDNTITIDGRSNIVLDNIAVEGADGMAIKLANAQNVRIQNCSFNFSGNEVINGNNSNNIVVENSTFNNSLNSAMIFYNTSNSAIRNNRLLNSGMIPGMGQSGNGGYQGIHIGGSNNVVELNSVENTGYCGITFSGDNVTIKNNFVNWFTMTKDDGAGVYSWGETNKYNRQIVSNIIMNGVGVAEGTHYTVSTGSSGITLDDATANVDMINNTIVNCSRAGIFIHNSHEVNITGNTFFNNTTQLNLDHDDIAPTHPIRNINLNNNVLFSKLSSQYIMMNQSLTNDFTSMGTLNYNWYARPLDDNGIINNFYKDSKGDMTYSWYDLEGWRTRFNFDWNTAKSPIKIPSYITNSLIGSNKFPNGDFNLNVGGLFCLGNCGISLNFGRLDGGALQIAPTLLAKENLGAYLDIGPVTAGTKYIVKFTTLGSSAGKTMRAYVMKNGGAYDMLSEMKYIAIGTGRTENEFMFTSPVTAPYNFLGLTVYDEDAPIWIDNVKIYEANLTTTNPDDYIRFEYNATTSNKSVALDGTYIDVKNNRYSGTITLNPFTSLVLIKQSSSLVADQTQTSAAASRTLQVTDAADASKALSLNITPNPSTDKIQILFKSGKENEKATLSINSVSGVAYKKMPVTVSNQALTVDISKWGKGVYIVTLMYEDGTVVNKKFVKQ